MHILKSSRELSVTIAVYPPPWASGFNFYTMVERVRGYKAAIREAHGEVQVDIKPHDRSAEEIEAVLASRLREKTLPRAIFCLKNSITMHTYHALRALRREVPSQVALVGYDDFELAETLRPSITVVQQPVEEIGRKAANLLFQMLAVEQREPNGRGYATETLSPRAGSFFVHPAAAKR